MIVGLLTVFLILLSLALGLFILIQQGKGDMGLGSLSGGSQVLFGGSGGQDFFQKATWVMGLIFMGICLFLTVYKDRETALAQHQQAPISASEQAPIPTTESVTPTLDNTVSQDQHQPTTQAETSAP